MSAQNPPEQGHFADAVRPLTDEERAAALSEFSTPRASNVELPEVKVLRLQAGDILVAKVGDRITSAQVEDLQRRLTEEFPDHKILVLSGLDLEIARPEGGLR